MFRPVVSNRAGILCAAGCVVRVQSLLAKSTVGYTMVGSWDWDDLQSRAGQGTQSLALLHGSHPELVMDGLSRVTTAPQVRLFRLSGESIGGDANWSNRSRNRLEVAEGISACGLTGTVSVSTGSVSTGAVSTGSVFLQWFRCSTMVLEGLRRR